MGQELIFASSQMAKWELVMAMHLYRISKR